MDETGDAQLALLVIWRLDQHHITHVGPQKV